MEQSKAGTPAVEDFRDYAWNYFQLHADHRLRAFQFYITLSTALVGAFVVLAKSPVSGKSLSIVGFSLIFVSFVFWKFEERTRSLVKNAEDALNFLDNAHSLPDIQGAPHPLRLFARDDHKTSLATKWPLIDGHFSYSRCFRWVFCFFSLIGLAISLASFFLL